MYQPAIFREERIEVLHALMRAHPFATLVSSQSGTLAADHLPLVFHHGDGNGKLRGHVAVANPLCRECVDNGEALAVFQGPESYVTPTWYPSKQDHGKVVPTWNYAIVQARGRLTFHRDHSWLLEHLKTLTQLSESQRAVPWEVSDAPQDYIDRQMNGIVGLELDIAHLDGKWKVSQNKDARDREGVAAGLTGEGREGAKQVAELVRGGR